MPDFAPLHLACSHGALHPCDWARPLWEMVENPSFGPRDLLRACEMAQAGLDEPQRRLWMENLLEFSLWATGSIPQRLDLCQHLVGEGLAPFSSARRWADFGGLLHIACEAGSLQAIEWALAREPLAATRPGGKLGIGALHSLALNVGEGAARAATLLIAAGADPRHRSRDGRCALFRCAGNPQLSRALIQAGADPLAPDLQGYCALGLWLEWGDIDSAAAAFDAGVDLQAPLPWGSCSRSPASRLDRPLFIAACSPSLAGGWGGDARRHALDALAGLGADPLALDASGRTLFERSQLPQALALMEEAALRAQGKSAQAGGRKAL